MVGWLNYERLVTHLERFAIKRKIYELKLKKILCTKSVLLNGLSIGVFAIGFSTCQVKRQKLWNVL